MTLEKRIASDFLTAFKAKNIVTKQLLGTLKGEMETLKKNLKVEELSDEESLKLLNKFAKNLRETIALTEDPKSLNELDIIETYLPKQMTREEILEKIDTCLSNGLNNVGQIMKEFSGLQVDKKLVSELIKTKI